MEIRLPNKSLHDLLGILSFYKTCPGCRIGFVPPKMEARIVVDVDIVQTVFESLEKVRKETEKGVLFGITFTPDGEWKYNWDSFMSSDMTRCYAHEFQEKEKEEKREYEKSPLILLKRNDAFLSYAKKGSFGGKLLKCFENFNLEIVREILSGSVMISPQEEVAEIIYDEDVMLEPCPGCSRNMDCLLSTCPYCKYDLTGTTTTKQARYKQEPDKIFGCGWDPYLLPNNANFIQSTTSQLPTKTLMAIMGLSLFETYLVGRKVSVDGFRVGRRMVDGFRSKHFLVPLSKNPLTLEDFRLWHRHPKIWKHWDNGQFWKSQGLVGCDMFTLRKVGMYDECYETRRRS